MFSGYSRSRLSSRRRRYFLRRHKLLLSRYLTQRVLSNYPALIMERIVPHRSPRRHRRGGGNHPFVWVSVCNDFSLLLPSDLHVLYKCVCVLVCYC